MNASVLLLIFWRQRKNPFYGRARTLSTDSPYFIITAIMIDKVTLQVLIQDSMLRKPFHIGSQSLKRLLRLNIIPTTR